VKGGIHLRIEVLDSNETTSVVGVSEIDNSNTLKQDELLNLAKSLSSPVLTVQLMNGQLITDETHLLSAAQNALNAQHGNYMHARSLDVEIIVYASAQRQISRALEDLGVFDGLERVAAVVIGTDRDTVNRTLNDLIKIIGNESKRPFEATKNRFERIMKHFQIDIEEVRTFTESEDDVELLEALSRCVVSRVSLVAIDS
jgi:tRNA threonylcarbamoyladenosine modification (KEOPS) complex Cgi121 subunit